MLMAALLNLTGAGGVRAASAQISFSACSGNYALACGHLQVPLSPSGSAAGTITLTLRRRRAPLGEARSAVIALAGGPGQAAIPFAESFVELLGPILDTRDLIVFDQRGTGLSGPLRCPALKARSQPRVSRAMRCGQQIGQRRGFYTTQESVADIEAIRIAGGYEKLVLYGTSYGTKLALAYAEEHPSHVEALVLDSVVPPQGPEPLHLDTFAAVPGVLRRLCAFHGCAHITSNPVADLRRLVAHMRGRAIRGHVYDGRGKRHTLHVGSGDLLDILVAGDLDPILRAEYPAAIRAAAEGQNALLARLFVHASGEEEAESEQPGDPAFDMALYYATVCEEEPFPWSRTASPSTRLAEVRAKIASLPPSTLAPFTAADVLGFGEMKECAAWPFSMPAPPTILGSPPSVPALIVSGAEDLRTPTADARAIAAQIPGSHLLVVPNTGHSALTTEPTECGLRAMRALFAGGPIASCPDMAPPRYLKPTPLAPRQLSRVPPEHGYRGRPGRTLAAVGLTLGDLGRQLSLAILEGGAEVQGGGDIARSGGLHGGWAGLSRRALSLKDYSYVPGVRISGWIGFERAKLRVGGRAAAHGTLRLGHEDHLVGALGGVAVNLAPKKRSGARARTASSRGGVVSSPQVHMATQPSGRALIELSMLASVLRGTEDAQATEGDLEALIYALSHSRGGALR